MSECKCGSEEFKGKCLDEIDYTDFLRFSIMSFIVIFVLSPIKTIKALWKKLHKRTISGIKEV